MNRISVERLEKIAESLGGQCLAVDFKSMDSPILWECARGHRWYASPEDIVTHFAWCPECGEPETVTIQQMRAFADRKGGKCLSSVYLDDHTKLRWQCEHGHQWEAAPADMINRDAWCPTCADGKHTGRRGWTIEDMRRIAGERGGRCLSEKFVNLRTKLLWECRDGHRWEASPGNVITRHSWCPQCARKSRITIEDMKEIARQRGGECLSDTFVNTRSKLLWQCKIGHQWEATPHSITVNRSWCPECARKVTIRDMQEYARKKGGKCLSETYVNSNSKLLWECENGHIWLATPRSVTYRGKWCPFCPLM